MSNELIFFQIGTNDGNDKFRDLVREKKPSLVILVEPICEHEETIRKNYGGIPNVILIHRAIGYKDNEDLQLYIPKKPFYTSKHFSLVPMNDWGEKDTLLSYNCKTITFHKICEDLNINKIDYLQIDTEGFDTEIIQMIDFNKIKINQIRYEKWSFNSSEFTKFNAEKADHLGASGMIRVREKLLGLGYTLEDINDEDGNDILATLYSESSLSPLSRIS